MTRLIDSPDHEFQKFGNFGSPILQGFFVGKHMKEAQSKPRSPTFNISGRRICWAATRTNNSKVDRAHQTRNLNLTSQHRKIRKRKVAFLYHTNKDFQR